ncbi:host-nuclease inhibitor Gam family protein [Methylobacterium aquaticum]|jgi:phage host-nuclease inhibitor protein Gam|uniref:Mu-like prophage host-nuclease inhibitor protein Gam n=1 Tax=Methylobacterium aquaticum TaxID=270351 RepID=A0A0J6V143_9HYPH|nr:host-nuclease inhibitor Gam family protein [Methylobacterium aquaticum]KMO32501.1 hypothetical protein VP06_17625 [Methylobacterium aquaticum]
MAKAKTKSAGTNLPVPQSDAEAEVMIAQLGALQRDQAALQAKHDGVIAELEAAHAATVKASAERQTVILEGLAIWASANRERLTNGGRTKTVQLATGTVLWREGRYAVKHPKMKIEDVIEAVRERIRVAQADATRAGDERRPADRRAAIERISVLEGFLRKKVELDKSAMLAARDVAETVLGVTVPRGPEEFAVEPLASQIREVA